MSVRATFVATSLAAVLLAATGCGAAERASADSAHGAPIPTAVSSPHATRTADPSQAGRMAGPAKPVASPSPTPTATPTPTPKPTPACPYPTSGFDCDFQHRFAAAQAYLRTRPGTVGIVVRDRTTGAVWRNSYADTLVWTASTVKLAMSVDLLLRDRAGSITLTDADRGLIHNMLNFSDDNAADTLWFKYGGADFATRFPSYGLTGITFVPGFQHYWGYMKCAPSDLDRLIQYVLTRLPVDLRDYVVNQMRHVAADQQWGVWGAGPAAQPGNKDGWSLEQGGWVINSVGFVGPGQRYTLAMMNSLNGQGGYADGTATISHVAQLIFTGRF
ncbi:MAG TPA: tat pathway signal sequence [Mycobacteriales bacterium]|nr:tat pathway signal sequence [Mycobacteriales bacterium]